VATLATGDYQEAEGGGGAATAAVRRAVAGRETEREGVAAGEAEGVGAAEAEVQAA